MIDRCVTEQRHSQPGVTSRPLLAVIGAGASYDCIAHESEDIAPKFRVTTVNPRYRPPLAKDLFSPQPAFNEILDKYPLVTNLSEEIRSRLRPKNEQGAITLEQIL